MTWQTGAIRFQNEVVETLLKATYLNVDETQLRVNDGYEYVWVITDGSHVYFRHTENRESGFISEFLAGFTGILVTDFYPGFDAIKCRHQKCLVHLIRDMNNDLWASPFDDDFGGFVAEFRRLLVPIMAAIQKCGLKTRHLGKYRRDVSRFHEIHIETKSGGSDLSQRYRKRLAKYWDNLFTFLECDGVPWHNNGAENALRHITLQSDTSRIFRRNTLIDYLKLLGCKQTCKFQNRSFLKFLLSLREP